jgi:hypothetical protein
MRSRLQHLRRGKQNRRHPAFETAGFLGGFERMQGGEIFGRIHPVPASWPAAARSRNGTRLRG